MLWAVFLTFSTTDTLRCFAMGQDQIVIVDGCPHTVKLLIVIVQRKIIRDCNVLRALVLTDAVTAGSTWNRGLRANDLCHLFQRIHFRPT